MHTMSISVPNEGQAAPITNARRIAVAIYANDRTTTPTKRGLVSWEKFAPILTKHDIRAEKGGKAFAPHALKAGGSRRNADVEAVSMLVADSDNGVPFDEVCARFDGLHAAIYTTHSHTLEKTKCRAVVPFANEVCPDDWPALRRGAEERFGADIFDPAAKDPARLYYFPSCPPERAEHRRAELLTGHYLDPAPLIERGRALLAAEGRTLRAPHAAATSINDDLMTYDSEVAEVAENVERVKSALAALSADCDYADWRDTGFAVQSLGWASGFELFDQWSQQAPDRYEPDAVVKLWNSATPGGGVGIGTLLHRAKLAGWVDPRSAVPAPGAELSVEKTMRGASGDIVNGQLFASRNRGKLKFVDETGDVLAFDGGKGWHRAPPGHADRAAKDTIAALRGAAAERYRLDPDAPTTKRLMAHVERSSTAPKLDAMVRMAKSEDGMTVQLHELDADRYLLGLENGVFDLRTGTLLPPAPALLVTKRCAVAYDPTGTAPVWEAFIERITGGNTRLAGFLQRLAGYLLTGDVGEQCFAFLYGLGRNGKTTYAEALRGLLGDYAVILPTSTLMIARRDPGAASPDLMLLKGARLALANETEENARLAESVVKSLTGGDTITARDPYGKFATWSPTHKLLLVGNHRPVIAGGDWGIWRRVCLVPFTETIADHECDPQLPEKIRAEGSGVLNWCLDGYRAWRREGLNPPPEIRGACDEYREDMDIIGQWLAEHTVTAPGKLTPTSELYLAYQAWAKATGWHPMTAQSFGRRLAERGIALRKAGTARTKHAEGIDLNGAGFQASLR